MNEDKYIFKIITMGDANSGKTLLCSRMCKTVPERGYMPTIGVEFSSVELTYQDKCIKMQLWDTAGQECFAPIVRNYYKKIAGIFFVIDLTSERSIKNIDYWLQEYEKNRYEDCETIILALGNKIDCEKRIISYKDISNIFKKKNIDYFEISAKKSENIKYVQYFMVDKILKNFDINNHPGIIQRKLPNDIRIKNRDSCSYLIEDQKSCCNIS